LLAAANLKLKADKETLSNEIQQLTQNLEKLQKLDVGCQMCDEDTVIGVQYICSKCNLNVSCNKDKLPTYEIFKELPNVFIKQQ